MAACPCGCGRSVGWSRKRIALHAHDLNVALPIVKHYADVIVPTVPEEIRPKSINLFINEGDFLAGTLLDYAHGEATYGYLPSQSELNEWRRGANIAVASTAMADEVWLSRYVAALDPADRRLVNSMVATGTRMIPA